MIGWTLSALVVVSLVAIGLGAVVAPRAASAQFGLGVDDPRALGLVRAMGMRDVVIGGLLGLVALAQARDVLGWGMWVSVLIAVTDLAVVTADRRVTPAERQRRPDAARLLHASGAVGLILTGTALLAGY
jgi:uncharacterized protein DUF4267